MTGKQLKLHLRTGEDIWATQVQMSEADRHPVDTELDRDTDTDTELDRDTELDLELDDEAEFDEGWELGG